MICFEDRRAENRGTRRGTRRSSANRLRTCLLLTVYLAGPAAGWAEAASPLTCAPAPVLPPAVTPAAHAERAAQLKALLNACLQTAAQCNPANVGPDEQLQLDGKTVTRIRLEWLRAGMRQLGSKSGSERKAIAADLSARLAQLGSASTGVNQTRVQQASAQLSQVLATSEFTPDREPNWQERKWMEFKHWLREQLTRSFEAVSRTPAWVGYFFEALLFLVPVVLLLVWLMRQMREDRLRSSPEAPPRGSASVAPAADWLALAEELARQSQWREAIHALYWATIATLESRRLWSVNRTRTPREYIRLLELGSAARAALAEQTRQLERIWYGQQEASQADFDRASQLFEAQSRVAQPRTAPSRIAAEAR